MPRHLRILASTLAAALLAFLAQPLYLPFLRPPGLAEEKTTAAAPLQMEHFAATMATLYQHRGARLALQATAATAAGDVQGEHIAFTRLAARFFGAGPPTVVQGKEGVWQGSKQILRLTGKVRVTAPTFTATAPDLTVYAASRLLAAKGPVRIANEEYTVTGQSLRYALDTGRLLVEGKGQGRVRFSTHKNVQG